MRCRNCGQTRRVRLLIELAIQLDANGTTRLPVWSLGLECPTCDSTDVEGAHSRLLALAIDGPTH